MRQDPTIAEVMREKEMAEEPPEKGRRGKKKFEKPRKNLELRHSKHYIKYFIFYYLNLFNLLI